MMQFFSNTFKDNIAQVPAVIDDTLLKPFTEVVQGDVHVTLKLLDN